MTDRDLLLVALENPGLVRLPLPLGQGELLLSTGTALACFALLGGAYAALLLLPGVLRAAWQGRRERRERQSAEQRLIQSLQARLGSVPAPTPSAAPAPVAVQVAPVQVAPVQVAPVQAPPASPIPHPAPEATLAPGSAGPGAAG